MTVLITSQFGYCPLIWMFHGRALNNKTNSTYERVLGITCIDSKYCFLLHSARFQYRFIDSKVNCQIDKITDMFKSI